MRRRSCLWLVLALSQAPIVPAFAQPDRDAKLAAYAERLLDEQGVRKDGPGVTLLVAQGDRRLYEGARGMASIELGVSLQPDHVMRLGSITKQFAAATLLRLIDEGRAGLDDPLSKYLPDYPGAASIRLAHLLNHSSGVPSYTNIPGYMDNPVRAKLDTAGMLRVFKDLPPEFPSGEGWNYNNSGYVLVGAVIEAITHKPWHEALDAALLAPRHIDVRYPGEQGLVPGMVQGYTSDDQGRLADAGMISMSQPHAAGALVGNVEALWRWNLALHGGQMLQPETYRRMVTPEGPALPVHYGYGITALGLRGEPLLQHGGGIHGFRSILYYLPQSRISVALLANSDSQAPNLDLMARKLAAQVLGKPYPAVVPVVVDASALKACEGDYTLDGKDNPDSLRLRVVDGQLTATRGNESALKLIPLGKRRFAVEGSLAQVSIDDPLAAVLRFYPDGDGEADRWLRVSTK